MLTRYKILFLGFTLILSICALAQNYSHQQNVVEFLNRMSQKGYIEIFDLVKPLERSKIFSILIALIVDTLINCKCE